MELDLQSIWQRQSVPESVTKALEQIAEQVFYRITDPNRPTINVTQWCKREGCWNSVQEINLTLPAEFSSVLIGKTEVRAAEKEARKEEIDVAKLMDKTQTAQQARLAESKVAQVYLPYQVRAITLIRNVRK